MRGRITLTCRPTRSTVLSAGFRCLATAVGSRVFPRRTPRRRPGWRLHWPISIRAVAGCLRASSRWPDCSGCWPRRIFPATSFGVRRSDASLPPCAFTAGRCACARPARAANPCPLGSGHDPQRAAPRAGAECALKRSAGRSYARCLKRGLPCSTRRARAHRKSTCRLQVTAASHFAVLVLAKPGSSPDTWGDLPTCLTHQRPRAPISERLSNG